MGVMLEVNFLTTDGLKLISTVCLSPFELTVHFKLHIRRRDINRFCKRLCEWYALNVKMP